MKIWHLFFAILLTGCGQENPVPPKPLVLVSIAPYQFFVHRIAGDKIDVRSIVTLGADAHTFEPTPRQRESLKNAVAWFRIGEPFERPLTALFQHCHIVDLRNGITLLDDQDRHLWMSPKIAKIQVRTIAKVLAELFPHWQAAFELNSQVLLNEIDALDSRLQQTLEPVKNQVLLVSHPAFAYFCRDYSLLQLSIEFDGKEPCPKHLEQLLNHKRPDIAIALPQHNNKGVQMMAKNLHLPIKVIDPYSYDYFETMHTLMQWVAFHL